MVQIGVFIGERKGCVDRKPAELCERHFRQYQPIVNLCLIDLRLVELYFDCQQVGAGGHTFIYHGLYVGPQGVEQGHVAERELLLGLERDDLPVGCVDGIDDVLRFVAAHLAGQLLGEVGQAVHGHDLAPHVDRLRQGDCAEKHVVDVVGHSLLGNEGHGFGHVLAVRLFERLAGQRILCNVEFIFLCGRVECLCGQQLVGIEDRDFLLIVGIASGKINRRQICREGSPVVVMRRIDSLAPEEELLVAAQGHVAARVKAYGHGLTAICGGSRR